MLNFRKVGEWNRETLIENLMEEGFLKNFKICNKCNNPTTLVNYKRNKDGKAWRCNSRACQWFKKYFSVREGSFLDGMDLEIASVLKNVADFGTKRTRKSIVDAYTGEVSERSVDRILQKLKSLNS